MKSIQLMAAIAEIQKWRIDSKEMIILAPPNTLFWMGAEHVLDEWYAGSNKLTFQGILVVEDEHITKVIVRSLISNHRIEIEEVK